MQNQANDSRNVPREKNLICISWLLLLHVFLLFCSSFETENTMSITGFRGVSPKWDDASQCWLHWFAWSLCSSAGGSTLVRCGFQTDSMLAYVLSRLNVVVLPLHGSRRNGIQSGGIFEPLATNPRVLWTQIQQNQTITRAFMPLRPIL